MRVNLQLHETFKIHKFAIIHLTKIFFGSFIQVKQISLFSILSTVKQTSEKINQKKRTKEKTRHSLSFIQSIVHKRKTCVKLEAFVSSTLNEVKWRQFTAVGRPFRNRKRAATLWLGDKTRQSEEMLADRYQNSWELLERRFLSVR